MCSGNRIKTTLILAGVACLPFFLSAQVMSTREYIDAYKFAAMQEMKVYKIPASITLGQGILESASGNSKLARECNNHFGIKCRKNWTGQYCLVDDDAPNECFRGYPSAMESYRDHSMFLTGNTRYNSLFSLAVTDYKGWANGLRLTGYATNPAYGNTLIGIIERYRLGRFDSAVLLGDDYLASQDSSLMKPLEVNGITAVYAQPGESPKDIAVKHDMGLWQIYKYNDLKRGDTLDPGEIVYLKPKRRKGSVPTAVVGPGQTMRDVSQQYGIKLKQLYRKNHLKQGQQVVAGEVLNLQKKSDHTPQVKPPGTRDPEPVKPQTQPKPKTENQTPDNDENFHEVQPGETLYGIAKKHGVTVDDLKRWNNLGDGTLKPGQLLVLKKGVKPYGHNTGDSVSTTKNSLDKSVRHHIVLAGETVATIAKIYNQPADSIIAWNQLKGKVLKPGMELIVSPPSKNKQEDADNPRTYTVQPGDTLYSISRKFGVTVDALRQKNNISGNALSPGQVLSIP